MAPPALSAGYDLGLSALVALFVFFYVPLVYLLFSIFRQQQDKSDLS